MVERGEPSGGAPAQTRLSQSVSTRDPVQPTEASSLDAAKKDLIALIAERNQELAAAPATDRARVTKDYQQSIASLVRAHPELAAQYPALAEQAEVPDGLQIHVRALISSLRDASYIRDREGLKSPTEQQAAESLLEAFKNDARPGSLDEQKIANYFTAQLKQETKGQQQSGWKKIIGGFLGVASGFGLAWSGGGLWLAPAAFGSGMSALVQGIIDLRQAASKDRSQSRRNEAHVKDWQHYARSIDLANKIETGGFTDTQAIRQLLTDVLKADQASLTEGQGWQASEQRERRQKAVLGLISGVLSAGLSGLVHHQALLEQLKFDFADTDTVKHAIRKVGNGFVFLYNHAGETVHAAADSLTVQPLPQFGAGVIGHEIQDIPNHIANAIAATQQRLESLDSFKTFFAAGIATAVTSGIPFLNRRTRSRGQTGPSPVTTSYDQALAAYEQLAKQEAARTKELERLEAEHRAEQPAIEEPPVGTQYSISLDLVDASGTSRGQQSILVELTGWDDDGDDGERQATYRFVDPAEVRTIEQQFPNTESAPSLTSRVLADESKARRWEHPGYTWSEWETLERNQDRLAWLILDAPIRFRNAKVTVRLAARLQPGIVYKVYKVDKDQNLVELWDEDRGKSPDEITPCKLTDLLVALAASDNPHALSTMPPWEPIPTPFSAPLPTDYELENDDRPAGAIGPAPLEPTSYVPLFESSPASIAQPPIPVFPPFPPLPSAAGPSTEPASTEPPPALSSELAAELTHLEPQLADIDTELADLNQADSEALDRLDAYREFLKLSFERLEAFKAVVERARTDRTESVRFTVAELPAQMDSWWDEPFHYEGFSRSDMLLVSETRWFKTDISSPTGESIDVVTYEAETDCFRLQWYDSSSDSLLTLLIDRAGERPLRLINARREDRSVSAVEAQHWASFKPQFTALAAGFLGAIHLTRSFRDASGLTVSLDTGVNDETVSISVRNDDNMFMPADLLNYSIGETAFKVVGRSETEVSVEPSFAGVLRLVDSRKRAINAASQTLGLDLAAYTTARDAVEPA